MNSQKGPWEVDEWGNVVDANEHIIKLAGTVLPSTDIDNMNIARANKSLILEAPTLNHIVGKLLDVMSNPYSNNEQRINKIYALTEEMKLAYQNGAEYDE